MDWPVSLFPPARRVLGKLGEHFQASLKLLRHNNLKRKSKNNIAPAQHQRDRALDDERTPPSGKTPL
jgi:hypothetical protein